MRRLACTITALLMLLLIPAAGAEEEDATKARNFYQKGMAHYQLDEYEAAILDWQEGFRLRPAPEFLYNLAQAYRLSRQHDKALSFYRKYLNMAPTAANRPEVERHIAALQKIVAAQQKVTGSPPTGAMRPAETGHSGGNLESPRPAEPAPPKAEPAPPAPPPPSATPPAAVVVAPAPVPPEKKPITKRAWFWGAIGGGVVAVALAVGLGVGLGVKVDPKGSYGTVAGN
jgi:iron complex outermembrane receptor protein